MGRDGRGCKVVGRGYQVMGRGYKVVGRGYKVVGRGYQVAGAKSLGEGTKSVVFLVPWGFEGQPFLVSNIKYIKSCDNWEQYNALVLHQKSNSETSNNDINNNEINYPKVTSTSKITSQLHF